MIDFYSLLAILLAYSLKHIQSHRIIFNFLKFITIVLVCINLIQSYQHRNGILPGEGPSREEYFDKFLRIFRPPPPEKPPPIDG